MSSFGTNILVQAASNPQTAPCGRPQESALDMPTAPARGVAALSSDSMANWAILDLLVRGAEPALSVVQASLER